MFFNYKLLFLNNNKIKLSVVVFCTLDLFFLCWFQTIIYVNLFQYDSILQCPFLIFFPFVFAVRISSRCHHFLLVWRTPTYFQEQIKICTLLHISIEDLKLTQHTFIICSFLRISMNILFVLFLDWVYGMQIIIVLSFVYCLEIFALYFVYCNNWNKA